MAADAEKIIYRVGQKVIWHYDQPGGYNLTIPVTAEVVKVNAKTVTIRAFKRDGTFNVRHVKAEKLVAKEWNKK